MLTIEDIRDAARPSGFLHVVKRGDGARSPYVANVYGGKLDKSGRLWQGPRRRTAEEAAQDYCDYVNGNGVSHVNQLRSAGHSGKREAADKPAEILHAEGLMRDWRAQQEGRQGYVYCIAEAEGVSPLVKIGYSTNPEARVAELQTGNGRHLFLLGYFAGTMEDERKLHMKFLADNTVQEWFRPSDELLSEFGFDMYDLYEKGPASLR